MIYHLGGQTPTVPTTWPTLAHVASGSKAGQRGAESNVTAIWGVVGEHGP